MSRWFLLASPFTLLRGDRSGLQRLSPPSTPSAAFCASFRPLTGRLSPESETTAQISGGKTDRFRHTAAGFTLCALDGSGLRGNKPARPSLTPHIRFLSIGSCLFSTLLFGAPFGTPPLRFTSPSPPSGWAQDSHLPAILHARHTCPTRPRPSIGGTRPRAPRAQGPPAHYA